jgi:catechol-2,3-dioxygenase
MAPEKVLSPARLAHIVLRTEAGERFEAMKTFYREFLGAYPEVETEMLSFLRYDDEHHRVAIIGIPGIGKRDRSVPGLEVLYPLANSFSLSAKLMMLSGSTSPSRTTPCKTF